jgi:GTP diphosphokinase / guanosine-3',5'-bis(diphosphate) 3'-diphosphatase
VNGPVAYAGAPWGDLIAEFCEVIVAVRPHADVELIGCACDVAARWHQGQTRYSGDPYITHPVAVATILARLDETGGVDDQMLCAAVVHDTVEDTPYTLTALRNDFDTAIAAMVAEHMTLHHLGGRRGHTVTQAMARCKRSPTPR